MKLFSFSYTLISFVLIETSSAKHGGHGHKHAARANSPTSSNVGVSETSYRVSDVYSSASNELYLDSKFLDMLDVEDVGISLTQPTLTSTSTVVISTEIQAHPTDVTDAPSDGDDGDDGDDNDDSSDDEGSAVQIVQRRAAFQSAISQPSKALPLPKQYSAASSPPTTLSAREVSASRIHSIEKTIEGSSVSASKTSDDAAETLGQSPDIVPNTSDNAGIDNSDDSGDDVDDSASDTDEDDGSATSNDTQDANASTSAGYLDINVDNTEGDPDTDADTDSDTELASSQSGAFDASSKTTVVEASTGTPLVSRLAAFAKRVAPMAANSTPTASAAQDAQTDSESEEDEASDNDVEPSSTDAGASKSADPLVAEDGSESDSDSLDDDDEDDADDENITAEPVQTTTEVVSWQTLAPA